MPDADHHHLGVVFEGLSAHIMGGAPRARRGPRHLSHEGAANVVFVRSLELNEFQGFDLFGLKKLTSGLRTLSHGSIR